MLHKGLTNDAAKAKDASHTPPKGSVNDDAVRSATAKASKTLGPRTA